MSQFDYITAFIGQLGHATTPAEIFESLLSFMTGLLPTAAMHDSAPLPGAPWKGHARDAGQGGRPAEWQDRQANRLDRDPTRNGPTRLQEPVRRCENSIRFESDSAEDKSPKDRAPKGRGPKDRGNEAGPPDGTAFPPVSFDRRTMTVSLGDEAVELSPAEFGMVSLAATCAIGRAMQLQGKQARQVDQGDLTPRERECLQWAATGKSEWEISQILGISEHTSEKHLLNAKTKLGAANRVQAVADAIRRGYIN